MEWYCNLPYLSVFLAMGTGIGVSAVKSGRTAYRVTVHAAALISLMSLVFLFCIDRVSISLAFPMGKFPAPFGNEIRFGPLQGLFASCFSIVMTLALLGGRRDFFDDVTEKKQGLACVFLLMTLASLLVLTYTNDAFTGYVFIEISTISACALVSIKDRGPTLMATIRYLFMSLLGSGLFLFGLVLLYTITGHLLMPQLMEKIQVLAVGGRYRLPLLMSVSLMTAGLGIKSAMFPFHRWLPDAHGSATTTASAVLSGLVLKGYIVLMITLFVRVFTIPTMRGFGIGDVIFVFGLLGMIVGSLYAMRENHIKRMLAYSSVAQIGYIFMGIGLMNTAGITAACFHVLVHACSKPLLFISAGRLSAAVKHRKDLHDLYGTAYRAPLAGIGFTVGALSMIGVPLFAGFTSKLNFATASVQSMEKMLLTLLVLALSTVLNALYYIPAITVIWSRQSETDAERQSAGFAESLAILLLIALVFILGISYGPIARIIADGFRLM